MKTQMLESLALAGVILGGVNLVIAIALACAFNKWVDECSPKFDPRVDSLGERIVELFTEVTELADRLGFRRRRQNHKEIWERKK